MDFLETVPGELRGKFAAWGIIDGALGAAGERPAVVRNHRMTNGKTKITVMGGHLLQFQQSMKARNLADQHILQVITDKGQDMGNTGNGQDMGYTPCFH